MKRTVLFGGLLALTLALGCGKTDTTKPTEGGQTPASSGDTGDQSGGAQAPATADEATGQVAPTGGDATQVERTAAAAPAAPAVDETADAASDDVGAETDITEPAAPTLEDFQRQLMAAAGERDMAKALEVVDAALVSFPDDVGMQVNRFLIHLQTDSELATQNAGAAAESFMQTAAMARDLAKLGDQVPPQGQHYIPLALLNEARAYAHQGKVPESLQSLRAVVDAGMTELELEKDDFFASIRDNDQFKAGVAELKEVIRGLMIDQARKEIEETESFAFDFELVGLDQNPVKLADFKGKLVIVDFWGTWCPPCRMEIPHFIALKNAYPDDLAIVGINYEDEEGEAAAEKIRNFAQEQGINYPCVIGDQATQDQIPNLQGYPTTLFLDREGKVRLMVVGYHPYEQLEAYLSVLLAEGKG
jgi:thiol-disulfide isomerase/thioredoxin